MQHVLIVVSLSGCSSSSNDAESGTAGAVSAAAGTTATMPGAAQADGNAGSPASASSTAGSGPAATGSPSAAPDDKDDKDDTSFSTSVQPFIKQACNCHQSEPLMAPFSLKEAEAYDAIVNVPSMQLPSMMLVKPGSIDESYLWHKINGTFRDVGGSGMIMPFTIPLNENEKQIFSRWILAGAPP